MELIRISNRKIKLMLTPTDMSRFELNAETLGENPTQTHRALRSLLSELRDEIGLQEDGQQLSVQYFPSRDGGCEMFICNLHENENTGGDAMSTKSQIPDNRSLSAPRRISNCYHRDFAYRFGDLDDLLTVCNRLQGISYITQSAAYRDQKGRYYLFFAALTPSPFSIPDELGFIVEYGSMENAASRLLFAREHGSLICSCDAVEQLARLN